MSKEITDLLGKLNGDLIALQGMEQRISPPPPPPPPTIEQAALPPVPPAKPSKEDYEYVKKLCNEIKGLCGDVEAQIDKEMKVPPLPGEETSAAGASTSSSVGASAHKK